MSTKVKKEKTAYIKCVETAVADALLGARTACRGANPKKAKKEKATAAVRYLKALSATGEKVPYAKRGKTILKEGEVTEYMKFKNKVKADNPNFTNAEITAFGKVETAETTPKSKKPYTIYQFYQKNKSSFNSPGSLSAELW